MRSEVTKSGAGDEAADGKTQQIPLVQGPNTASARHSGNAGGQPARVNGAAAGDEHATTEIPQETVPMQAVSWPPAPTPTPGTTGDTAPTKPPPLRGNVKESRAGTHSTSADVSPRPGIFTAELRRALPPWALPLLTFQPFSVWLGSRLALGLLAVLAGIMIPSIPAVGTANWYGLPGGPPLNMLVDRLAGVWTRWDGQWYLKIATDGYRNDDGTAAFFPLYPWTVKVFGWLAGERYIWAGMLLSGIFFLAALVLLHRLIRLDFHPKDAHRTIFYVAAFPMAFFFWAVYSESLFLMLAVAALLAARTQRWWWAAVALSFAIWTRATGALLLLPIAWEMWRAFRPPAPAPSEKAVMPPRKPSRTILASFSLPVLSMLGLLAWSNAQFGDPLASLNTQKVWLRHFTWPWETVWNAFGAAFNTPFEYQQENQNWTYLVSFLVAIVLGALAIRWLRGSYSIYLWTGILFPLFSATKGNPLLSYPRFLIVLFPMFIVLGLLGRNRYAHQVITWVSIVLLALFTIRFVNWYWVA